MARASQAGFGTVLGRLCAASDSHGADALMLQWLASIDIYIVAPSKTPLIVWQGNSIDCSHITSLLHEEPSCQKRAMGNTPLLDFSHSKP